MNFQMYKLNLEKAEEPEIKLPTSVGPLKKQEFQKNIYCFIDYAKAFDCVDHNKLWKILDRWEYQTTLCISWENCMQVRSNSKNQTGNNKLVQNWERSVSRLYIVTLLI